MLSSVLNSELAITVNIQIMRTFTKIREMLATHKELKQKIEEMEKNTMPSLTPLEIVDYVPHLYDSK